MSDRVKQGSSSMSNNLKKKKPEISKVKSPYMKNVTPDYVNSLKGPTKGFLCPITSNTFGIQFNSFTIRNPDTKDVIFETDLSKAEVKPINYDDIDSMRKINYTFKKSFLEAKSIGTKVVFSVGDKPVEKFRMIERHYFKDKLLKNFDFEFPFCIPNTTNSWECLYEMPTLSKEMKELMLKSPYESQSDSFYFVGKDIPKLVMHNKAFYKYE